ncbi:hypothetical protein SGRIM119S_02531 [Streptomyces griseorubiginosus]
MPGHARGVPCLLPGHLPGAAAGDDQSLRVDADGGGVLRRPHQAGVTVLNQCGVRVFGRKSVLDGHDGRFALGDVRQEQLNGEAAVADDHSPAVNVVDRGYRTGRTRGSQDQQRDVGGAVGDIAPSSTMTAPPTVRSVGSVPGSPSAAICRIAGRFWGFIGSIPAFIAASTGSSSASNGGRTGLSEKTSSMVPVHGHSSCGNGWYQPAPPAGPPTPAQRRPSHRLPPPFGGGRIMERRWVRTPRVRPCGHGPGIALR